MTHPSFVRKGASLMQTRVMETPTDARSVAHFKRLRRSLVRACALNLIAQIALGTPLRFSGIRSQRRQTIAEKSSLAGGSIGSAVAKEFAAEGAEVFLAGRTRSNLEPVAKKITEAGGKAHAAVID